MPKLEHRKSRGGCSRCKKRKVKCDELKPSCGACSRHEVLCEYGQPQDVLPTPPSPSNSLSETCFGKPPSNASPRSDGMANRLTHTTSGLQMPMSVQSLLHPTPTPASSSAPHSPKRRAQAAPVTPLSADPPRNILEIRLTHHWGYGAQMASEGASMKTDDYWRNHVPQLAFEHPSVLNSVLALSAFRLARSNGKEDHYLLQKARQYFEAALIGQGEALAHICEENAEAVFATSGLLSVYALAALRDGDELLEGGGRLAGEPTSPFAGVLQWLRLASGSRIIWLESSKWFERNERMRALLQAPEFFTEDEVILRDENLHPFGSLLTWAAEYEYMTETDRLTYEKTVKYLGVVYRATTVDREDPMASLRRIIALPSRVPPKLRELVEEQRPRALCVLAHVFGIIKMVNGDLQYNKGIAERQVPLIWERVPVGWRECMRWPMRMIGREEEVGLPRVV